MVIKLSTQHNKDETKFTYDFSTNRSEMLFAV